MLHNFVRMMQTPYWGPAIVLFIAFGFATILVAIQAHKHPEDFE